MLNGLVLSTRILGTSFVNVPRRCTPLDGLSTSRVEGVATFSKGVCFALLCPPLLDLLLTEGDLSESSSSLDDVEPVLFGERDECFFLNVAPLRVMVGLAESRMSELFSLLDEA